MDKILSTEDLKRLMAEAKEQGHFLVNLNGAHFSDIDLRMQEVPVSLDLDDAIIDGNVDLSMANFAGSYISLDRAEIGGFLSLNGMEVTNREGRPEGIGLFLRGALVHGTTQLQDTKLNTLCVYAADFAGGGLFDDVPGLFRLQGTRINRLFVYPRDGEEEEFQRPAKASAV